MVAAPRHSRSFCMGPMPTDVQCMGSLPGEEHHGGSKVPSFVHSLMSPIMACWQPPIPPAASARPLHRGRSLSPGVDQHIQTTNIPEPHPNDVICGRGGSANKHVGNYNFRSLVQANKEMYVTLTKKQKMMVARKIVETIHNQHPPGRFLQKETATGTWFDIGLPRSLEKTSQALREKGDKNSASSASTSATSSYSSPATPDRDILRAERSSKSPTPQKAPLTPVTQPSTPGSVHSSPVGSAYSTPRAGTSSSNLVIPEIMIPEHLESQFGKRRSIKQEQQRRPVPPFPNGWDHSAHQPAYLPPPPPHNGASRIPYLNPYSRPEERPYPYPPNPYPHHIPPDAYEFTHRRMYHPPRPHASPRPQHLPPPPTHFPFPSHPRSPESGTITADETSSFLEYNNRSPLSSASKKTASSSSPTPVQSRQEAPNVSPGRAQAWKKRRTGAEIGTDSVSRKMERMDLTSPSSVHQSRSKARSFRHGVNDLSGLAALSSAALLKLDEAN